MANRWVWFLFFVASFGLVFYYQGQIEAWLTKPGPCASSYGRLTLDGAVSVAVVFGYKDARPAAFVSDRYERARFVDRLISRCEAGQKLCGFSAVEDNPEFFEKAAIMPNGQFGKIQVTVLGSSTGPNDDENRINEYQKWYSERTQKLFRRFLSSSDILFYNGHSRGGGGPDFFPPETYKSGLIKMDKYRSEKPGLKYMLEALRRRPEQSRLEILGLFSCASDKYFIDEVKKDRKDLGVIASTELLYYADALTNIVESLEKILAGKCESEINQAMRSDDPKTGSRIHGFF